jgi:hypothetical protein
MPKLTHSDIEQFLALAKSKLDINCIPVFVESGTYLGETTTTAAEIFSECHTIELDSALYQSSKQKLSVFSNVKCHHGDSTKVLSTLLTEISDPVFFWLDGHWSGGNTAKGSQDCPLLDELDVIMNKCRQKMVVVIDDVRLFGTFINEDWSEVTETAILTKFLSGDRLLDFDKIGDRMILYIDRAT